MAYTRNLDAYIKNLTWGHKWANQVNGKIVVTYSTDLQDWKYSSAYFYVNYSDDLDTYLLNDAQKKAVQQVFENYSQVADLTFTDVGDSLGDDTDIVIRQADMNELASGWAMPWYYEKNKIVSFYNLKYDVSNLSVAKDDILINTKVDNLVKGDRGYFVFLHEIGHSLGLKHPHDGGGIGNRNLPFYLDNLDYTIMSYNNNMQLFSVNSDAMPIGLQILDIATIQNLYGANMEHNKFDNEYILDGTHSLDGNDYTKNLKDTYRYVSETIWDAGGNDSLDSTSYNHNVILDLREGFDVKTGEQHYSLVGDTKIFIAFDVTIENAYSGNGNDTIYGNEYNNTIISNDGNDDIYAGDGDDYINSGNGNDYIEGGNGDDTIYAGNGNDEVYGENGNDVIYAGNGDDIIYGGNGNDIIYAQSGKNKLYGDNGNDIIYGGKDDDYIYGGNGNDIIYTGNGNDFIDSGSGNDIIYAGTGKNNIDASDGNDKIFIGKGSTNNISGGKGYDSFIIEFEEFDPNVSNYSKIIIKDFDINEDVINLESFSTYNNFDDLDLASNNRFFNFYKETELNLLQNGISYQIVLEYVDINSLSEDNFLFS